MSAPGASNDLRGSSVADRDFDTIHRVDRNVSISGYRAAADPVLVRGRGIRRIVKMFADDPSYPGGMHRHPGVLYHVEDAEDTAQYRIAEPCWRALLFIREGLRLTPAGLIVREKADRSDPHYALCKAVEAYDARQQHGESRE